MRLKKAATLFVGTWAVLFIMCITMDSQLTTAQQVGYTGAMALVAPLLYFVSERAGAAKGRRYSVRRPGETEILCRIEGEWVCPGTDGRPTHYIRKNRVFAFDRKEALYRIEDGKVYRAGEEVPFLHIEGDKVYCAVSGEMRYELQEIQPEAEK